MDLDQIEVLHVVAERVVDQGPDEFGAGREPRVVPGIDFELIHLPGIARDAPRGTRVDTRQDLCRSQSSTGPTRRASAGSNVLAPRRISAIDIGRTPMRLTNQLESGTSSIVLTLSARIGVRSPGDPN